MPLKVDRIVEQLDSVVHDWRDSHDERGFLEQYDVRRVMTRARAAIARFAPSASPYADDARGVMEKSDTAADAWIAEQLVAIAAALRDDYLNGGLAAVEAIVHADLYGDFLEMSAGLLESGYIGPAAVITGSVLEEHLRNLATTEGEARVNDRGRPCNVEHLGVVLRKVGVITEVERKSVIAWYALRNEAAHNTQHSIDSADVERMIAGVRDFVGNHPA